MAGSKAIEAVIFDMDGTLVDSERLAVRAWFDAGARLGADLTPDVVHSFIGRNRVSVSELLAGFLHDEDLTQELLRTHMSCFDELCTTELALKTGARESIEALRAAGIAVGLATSTHRERAMPRLERFGLQDAFASITCGNDVERSKPAPDIFLKAAERMGFDPAVCAVVEDSFNGVCAGAAAGMHVFMVPDIVQPVDEIASRCDAVLDTLLDLPAAVAAVA